MSVKRPNRLVTIYLLVALTMGFIAAINVPAFQMPMLMIFSGLLILTVLGVSGMVAQGVERLLFDIVPSYEVKGYT